MIPAILVATVLVAGAFAFSPVQQASTVHTGILGNTVELRDVVETGVAFPTDGEAANDNDDKLQITGAGPFCLEALMIDGTPLNGGDTVTFEGAAAADITIDGFSLLAAPGADAAVADNVKASVLPQIWAVEGNDFCTSTGSIQIALDTVSVDDGDTIDITLVYLIADQIANPTVSIVDT